MILLEEASRELRFLFFYVFRHLTPIIYYATFVLEFPSLQKDFIVPHKTEYVRKKVWKSAFLVKFDKVGTLYEQ